jgi:hypothetical protein
MTSLLTDAAGDASIFLDSANGTAQTVTQYPGGNQAAPNPLAAIVLLEGRTIDRMRGKGREAIGQLFVSSTTTLLNTDTWLVGTVLYSTDTFDDPIGALIRVKVRSYSAEITGPSTKAQ